ncbi:bifunctional 4-hydroxy-2-oxoglutarate aldolase/2-dehydro-3-deoxy-phosphogluconate aldolase [Parasphaerochaeta coccoides]|uniref:2-dehydro-3-deoxy-phosphogluconate aldolase n=1 Tax=Parasphaerochaeta coccoides (strain ATCC BAA-1237 / DSM 17374 / SPN1) TaxID=760011 RepID=F4GIY8_PARC1|nr:bifunctional 4-hydroxy-2-oxoglutarate aldolase/2-dehydro-3-deoxy-phosphogluconate aldolase [Parasphaerochaeta coccoides]AEC01283.1 2-dehydro-3-deoxyphosphogluconate aldolase/4-hydroxy-2-oxoglutarate aldolase [Parasphaerochaeta coccoides DSM 17374]
MHEDFFKRVHQVGIVPVVKIDDAARAEGLAGALIAGGIPAVEVTFRTNAAEEAIKRIVKKYPDMLVGAGTVTSLAQAKTAVAAGASFLVSPGFDAEVVDWAIAKNIPILPGVATPTDILQGIRRGLSVLKFFPAEASGGVGMLKNFAGPFPSLSFVPTGGISLDNLASYASQSNVLAVGGSWMVKDSLINAEDWAAITNMSRNAVAALQGFSFAHFGINAVDRTEADKASKGFEAFNMITKNGSSSAFMNTEIEIMFSKGRGTHGHVGFKCFDVERSIAYLSQFGLTPDETSFSYDAKGTLKLAYFKEQIGDFAVHLIRA